MIVVPSPAGALDGDGAAMQADEALHHGEAEAGALVGALVAAGALVERAADAGQVGLADADAGIGDDEVEVPLPEPRRPTSTRPPRGRELHRVRQQVDDHLPAGAHVGGDLHRRRRSRRAPG